MLTPLNRQPEEPLPQPALSVESTFSCASAWQPTPGPSQGDAVVLSEIIAVSETTIKDVEKLRVQKAGDKCIALVFDVSPLNVRLAKALFAEQGESPRVVIADHHNAAAPLEEVPGGEITAAEILVEMLPRLFQSGALTATGDVPVTILAVTNLRNIDPDAFISLALITSYCDPELRALLWKPETLDLLVRAARFGDTTFFGGLKLSEELTYNQLSPEIRLALALFQMINEEKADLVVEKRFSDAVTINNIRAILLGIKNAADNTSEGLPAPALAFLRELRSCPSEQIRQRLNEALGDAFVTNEQATAELQAKAIVRSTATGRSTIDEFADLQRQYVLTAIGRTKLREVFEGKRRKDLFGDEHDVQLDKAAVKKIFKSITDKIPAIIKDPENFRDKIESYLDSLKEVQRMAQAHLRLEVDPHNPGLAISVTTLRHRLDRYSNLLQKDQRFPIADWLRGASAAFGPTPLHLLTRHYGEPRFVVSVRYPTAGEIRPDYNLADPQLIDEITSLERSCVEAQIASGAIPATEKAVDFLFKKNLIMPNRTPHFSEAQLITLLHKYQRRVTPHAKPVTETVWPTVVTAVGETIRYRGDYHLLQLLKNSEDGR